jgi:hypothetical protein
MKVLVIYELIPEETLFYLVDAEGNDLERLKEAHGVYVNHSESDVAAAWLNEWLVDKPKLDLRRGQPIPADFDLVVHSGFGL